MGRGAIHDGRAAHEARFAAASAALEDHEIVQPPAKELIVERIEALAAVRAEKAIDRLHKTPPKIDLSP